MKPKKCFNCGCVEKEMIKVKHKGKVKWMCSTCLEGFHIEKAEEKAKERAEKFST